MQIYFRCWRQQYNNPTRTRFSLSSYDSVSMFQSESSAVSSAPLSTVLQELQARLSTTGWNSAPQAKTYESKLSFNNTNVVSRSVKLGGFKTLKNI